jgi:NAD(P)H-dependent FMN reductase
MYKLKIISATVRPGRKGPVIAKWIEEEANKHGAFEPELLDLGKINLPVFNESDHPMLKKYEHGHTKQWSAKIDEADAFVFVTGEYDHSYPGSLKNALEYLLFEWGYKPAGIVSYSIGPFAGVRAASDLSADLLTLKTIALAETVNIPNLDQFISKDGQFTPNEPINRSKDVMLNQLVRWTKGLGIIRNDN